MGMLLRKHRAVDNTAPIVCDGLDETVNEIVEDVESSKDESLKYSKSEIMRMSTADLKELAAVLDIPDASGKVLKEEIIAKLGL